MQVRIHRRDTSNKILEGSQEEEPLFLMEDIRGGYQEEEAFYEH